jgi:Mrp family chromosome partitioning ATPase
MIDTTMRKLLDDRDKAQTDLDQAKMIYGPSHRQIARLELNLQAAADKVDEYVDEYVDLHTPRPVAARTSTSQPSQAVAIVAQIVPPAPPAPPPLSPALQQLKSELDDMNRRIEVLKTEASMPKRLEIVSIGEFPVAVQDRRIKMSAVCGAGAGFLPLGLMVLAGLLRRSYTYCAEITEDFATRTPFVAAIPDVDVDDDVQLSDDASQCVHHLREAIRQNAHTFLITSPGQGDGRTSLVMSLALSICASGSRTVIIDADIVSRGMSKNLGLENAPGFYDALATCDVGSYVRLSRSGVAIVPAGQARKSDAMAISAASLTKILQQMRETFDVVLIDSGPLLPCVETTVIARQVDGVVLAIGRGQKQAVARDAIVKLGQLKANVLGTVFNRVEVEDFYRSIQHGGFVSATTSSGPREVSETLESFGPLVRSVALSLRKEVEVLSDSDPAAVRLRSGPGTGAAPAQTRAA